MYTRARNETSRDTEREREEWSEPFARFFGQKYITSSKGAIRWSDGPITWEIGRTKARFNWYLTRGRATSKGSPFNEAERLSGSLYRDRILNSECNERARLLFQAFGIGRVGDLSPIVRETTRYSRMPALEILEKLSWIFIYAGTLMFREFSSV